MKQLLAAVFFVIGITAFSSCSENETEEYVQERADSFAVHYYNWQYSKCLDYVTPESRKFLEFAATNVTEGNVQLLRSAEKDASVEIDEINLTDDDRATVKLTIHNFLNADTIGRVAKFHDEGTAEITLVKEGDRWNVELRDGLIRTAFRQQSE